MKKVPDESDSCFIEFDPLWEGNIPLCGGNKIMTIGDGPVCFGGSQGRGEQ